MKIKKTLWIVVAVIIMIALTSSGWVFNVVNQNNQLLQSNEMATLQTTFVQQYGGEATITQLVSPDKVYAALWTDGAGASHISWNIGGLWVTVWDSQNPPETPTP